MARYVAYFRVSTEKQGKSGLGLAAQHSLIERFLSDGDEVIAEYVEIQSGKNDERVELWKAINHAKRNDAKLLIAKLGWQSEGCSSGSAWFVCRRNPACRSQSQTRMATLEAAQSLQRQRRHRCL